MSNIHYRYIEPLDVLFLRGNKLFGDPGSYGESLIPPWPSVAAGAIRSRMLVDDDVDLTAFAAGNVTHPTLGTPTTPGQFTVTGFHLARRTGNGVEILVAPPADLVITQLEDTLAISAMQPMLLPTGLASSATLPLVPVLAQAQARSKPVSGFWLTQDGWQTYLNGDLPHREHLVPSSSLWRVDSRAGIGMSSTTRSVETGKLFSPQAIALQDGVGFVAGICGAEPPTDGLLRLGGDGRSATLSSISPSLPEPDYEAIATSGRCRLVLTTPGIFPDGWLPPGTRDNHTISLPGISARLTSAAVPRAETVSGWDLANWHPKPAQRVAPAGSVYWLEELKTSAQALRNLVENGLWTEAWEDKARRAEGFNRLAIGEWP